MAPESVGLGWSTATSAVLGDRDVRDAPGAEPHLGLPAHCIGESAEAGDRGTLGVGYLDEEVAHPPRLHRAELDIEGLGKLTWSVTEGLFTGGIVKRDARAQLVELGRGGRYLPGIE